MSDILEDKINDGERQINKYFEDNLTFEPYVDDFSTEQPTKEMENTGLTSTKGGGSEAMNDDSYGTIESPITPNYPKSDYVEIQVFFDRNEPGISFRDCTSEIPNELKNGSNDDVFYTRVAGIDETFWNDEKNKENESVIANDGNGGRRTVVTYMVSQEKMETIVETIQAAVDRHDSFVCIDVKPITKEMSSTADEFKNQDSQYDSLRKEIEDIIERATNEIGDDTKVGPSADSSQPDQGTDLSNIEQESDDNDFDPKRILDELKAAAEREPFEDESLRGTVSTGMYQALSEADKPPVNPNPVSENPFGSNEKGRDDNNEKMSQSDLIDLTHVDNHTPNMNVDSYYDTTGITLGSSEQESSKEPFKLNEEEKRANEEIIEQMNSMYGNNPATDMNLRDYYSMNSTPDSYEPEGFNK